MRKVIILVMGCFLLNFMEAPVLAKGGSELAVSARSCTFKGKKLYTGPRGGCYYVNRNAKKTYVDRSYCNCK